MIKLEDIFNAKTQSAFVRTKQADYAQRTERFFTQKYPHLNRTLDHNQHRKVIDLSYKRAKQRGFKTEREHWRFLVIVANCGSFFDDDPQYYSSLRTARWVQPTGEKTYHPYFPTLTSALQSRRTQIQRDFEDTQRVLNGFQQIYSRPRPVNSAAIATALHNCWPHQVTALHETDLRLFIEQSADLAQNRYGFSGSDMSGSDVLCITCLGLVLGLYFLSDPLFPWARDALQQQDASQRRHALGEGALGYAQALAGIQNE